MGGQFSYYTELQMFFFFSFVAAGLVVSTKQRDVLAKTCTSVGTFRITFGQSFDKCIEECQRRRRCEFIMYKHGIDECSLKDIVNVTALEEEEPVCMFAPIGDQERVGVTPCEKTSCGLTETCVTSKSDAGLFECVKSECPEPPAVSNAKVLSNVHGIGKRNRYQCDKKYVGKGEPVIICQNDGTWTPTNFTCSTTEATAGKDLGIAYLINVVGEKWVEGTELQFACKPGYQGLGVYTSAVLTKKGFWSPPTINCCNENITQFVSERRCEAVFNASSITKYGEFQDFCWNLGGFPGAVFPDVAETVFEQESYLCLLNSYTKSGLQSRLMDCLKRYDVTDLIENFSNFTYNELIDEVISRNLSGHWFCDSARWWAPNEPSGGEDENCILYGREIHGMYDVTCKNWENLSVLHHCGLLCRFPLPEISSVINSVK